MDGRRGERTRLPALKAVVAEHDQPRHLGQGAVLDGDGGRTPGHDHHGADQGTEPGQHRGPVRMDPGRGGVGHDR